MPIRRSKADRQESTTPFWPFNDSAHAADRGHGGYALFSAESSPARPAQRSAPRCGARTVDTRAVSDRQAAWDLYVIEYTSGVDKDPGAARARYLETLRRLDAAFAPAPRRPDKPA
jgi:hypothetical protein